MSLAHPDYLLFLACACLAFAFVPVRARPWALLALSLGSFAPLPPLHLGVLAASIAIDYGAALGIAASVRARRVWLGLSLAGNLGLLVTFKALGALQVQGYVEAADHAAGGSLVAGALLPLGLSFYTFQSLGYTLDVYRGRIEPCRSLPRFALFVAFFPQVHAGPIERARTLLPQLERTTPVGLESLGAGAPLIAFGLLKKVVLADRLRPPVLPLVDAPEGVGGAHLAVNAVALSALLYLDFSGYTDIARGSARLFGVRLSENFRAPYLATSVGDFARRWHVTLIDWIMDHVWAPLIGRRRPGAARLWAANLTAMSIFALWHGPRLNYLLAGALLGVLVSVEQLALRGRRPAWPARVFGWSFGVATWSFFVVCMFTPNLAATARYVGAALSNWTPTDALPVPTARLAAVLIGLWCAHAVLWQRSIRARLVATPPLARLAFAAAAFFLVARYRTAGAGDFVYYRF